MIDGPSAATLALRMIVSLGLVIGLMIAIARYLQRRSDRPRPAARWRFAFGPGTGRGASPAGSAGPDGLSKATAAPGRAVALLSRFRSTTAAPPPVMTIVARHQLSRTASLHLVQVRDELLLVSVAESRTEVLKEFPAGPVLAGESQPYDVPRLARTELAAARLTIEADAVPANVPAVAPVIAPVVDPVIAPVEPVELADPVAPAPGTSEPEPMKAPEPEPIAATEPEPIADESVDAFAPLLAAHLAALAEPTADSSVDPLPVVDLPVAELAELPVAEPPAPHAEPAPVSRRQASASAVTRRSLRAARQSATAGHVPQPGETILSTRPAAGPLAEAATASPAPAAAVSSLAAQEAGEAIAAALAAGAARVRESRGAFDKALVRAAYAQSTQVNALPDSVDGLLDRGGKHRG